MSESNDAFGHAPIDSHFSLIAVDDEHRAAMLHEALALQHREQGDQEAARAILARARRHWHRAAWMTAALLEADVPESEPEPPDKLQQMKDDMLAAEARIVELGGTVH